MWISAIRPVVPVGTHHTVLMVGPVDAPDGTVECESALVKPSIYASGVGTQPLVLPDGTWSIEARRPAVSEPAPLQCQ